MLPRRIAISVLSLLATPVMAADQGWQFSITPYAFAAAIDAEIGVGAFNADVDMSSHKVLDSAAEAAMVISRARKDKWSLALDVSYFNLVDSSVRGHSGALGNDVTVQLSASNKQWVWQPMVAYRVVDDGETALDLYAGLRYTDLESDLLVTSATDIPEFSGNARAFGANKSWTDGVLGFYGNLPFAQGWSVIAMGDLGTGGSDFTYQGLLGVNWQINDGFSTGLGYRVLYQDYQDGDFRWEPTFSGYMVGLGFHF